MASVSYLHAFFEHTHPNSRYPHITNADKSIWRRIANFFENSLDNKKTSEIWDIWKEAGTRKRISIDRCSSEKQTASSTSPNDLTV